MSYLWFEAEGKYSLQAGDYEAVVSKGNADNWKAVVSRKAGSIIWGSMYKRLGYAIRGAEKKIEEILQWNEYQNKMKKYREEKK